MGVKINFDKQAIDKIRKAYFKSGEEAMGELKDDLKNSQTMPFDIGDMQNNQTFVAVNDNTVSLVTGSPQARRLYTHPEYNFQKNNPNAGGEWLKPYISGDKEDFVKEKFSEIFKKEAGL